MNGRMENDLKIESKIAEIIKGQPVLVREYSNCLTGTAATRREYTVKVVRFCRYLAEKGYSCTTADLNRVKAADITCYIKSLETKTLANGDVAKTSSSYRALNWSAVNSFFTFLKENDYISMNPCEKSKRPSVKDKAADHHLETEEIKKVFEIAKNGNQNLSHYQQTLDRKIADRDTCIIELFLTLGIRASALSAINVEDIDFKAKKIAITDKGEKKYDKYLSDSTVKTLKKCLKNREILLGGNQSNALFITEKTHDRMGYFGIRKVVQRITGGAGKRVNPHALRHTYGTRMYELSNGDIKFTQEMLNHSNIQTTMRYINKDYTEQEKELQKQLALY